MKINPLSVLAISSFLLSIYAKSNIAEPKFKLTQSLVLDKSKKQRLPSLQPAINKFSSVIISKL